MASRRAGTLLIAVCALIAAVGGAAVYPRLTSATEKAASAAVEQVVATATAVAAPGESGTGAGDAVGGAGAALPARPAGQDDQEVREIMAERFRRVVTGVNATGQSIIAKDSELAPTLYGIWPQIDFWKTTSMPASLTADADTLGSGDQLNPPPNGTIFRMLEILPVDPSQTPAEAEQAAEATFTALNATNARQDSDLNPMMHTTASLDYVIVLRGEITLLVDDGETTLHPFDVVVQRGTNHYWINKGTEPVLMMGVMLDAK